MKKFIVSFFGDGRLSDFYKAEQQLEKLILSLLLRMEHVEFRVTGEDAFNFMAAAAVRLVRQESDNDNSSLVLTLSHLTEDYKNNKELYSKYYDKVEICNRESLARSDLLICFTKSNSEMLAKKQGKYIVNLAQEDGNE